MTLDDEIDSLANCGKGSGSGRYLFRTRHILYTQLVTLIPSVILGRSEVWGYGKFLQTGVPALLFGPATLLLSLSMFIFPAVIYILSVREAPRERRWWLLVPLSLLLSFVQFLAFMPLVQ
jgi:hypothetical protein